MTRAADMEDRVRDSSDDDEPSMPAFQLHAVTEALLADLDPTATATQDDDARSAADQRRRNFGRASRKWLRENASPDAKNKARGTPLVGGDSVALGPGFAALARPPRRPQKHVNFDLEEDASQRERAEEKNGENERLRYGLAGDATPYTQGKVGEDYQDMRLPGYKNGGHKSTLNGGHKSTLEVKRTSANTPDRPMRRVVISPPRRTGSSPETAHPPFPGAPRSQRTSSESKPGTAAAASSEKPAVTAPTRHRKVVVRGVPYRILRRLGRGGSGRVYEVMAPDTRTWAFKAIPLAALDDVARRQIENEVELLQSLRRTERVAALEDWCVDEARNAIHIVMELGQIDLETIIRDHLEREARLDTVFIGHYWREMLRCVAALHARGVVHADVKPANFVVIGGVLKLVDFGIAHGLPDDTAHVYLEQRAGTPSYMAPETLRVLAAAGGGRVVRFGTPSDVWSLGCVLHLMVYGRSPFAHIRGLAPKLLAIADSNVVVELESCGVGGVGVPASLFRTMMACLDRDPGRRPTAAGLLAGSADGMVRVREGSGMVGTPRDGDAAKVIGDVMESMATRPVRRELLDSWVAEAMDDVVLERVAT